MGKTRIYEKIDGMTIGQHINDNAIYIDTTLLDTDYGRFAEILGNRILRGGGILKELFPGMHISSVKELDRIKIEKGSYHQRGDLILQISYENGGMFRKKVVIFEIKYRNKHGNGKIHSNQLVRYCNMICNPGEYFHKADEVKVIFMVFDKIDTMTGSVSYHMSELSKDLARKILDDKYTRNINVVVQE